TPGRGHAWLCPRSRGDQSGGRGQVPRAESCVDVGLKEHVALGVAAAQAMQTEKNRRQFSFSRRVISDRVCDDRRGGRQGDVLPPPSRLGSPPAWERGDEIAGGALFTGASKRVCEMQIVEWENVLAAARGDFVSDGTPARTDIDAGELEPPQGLHCTDLLLC